VAEVAILPKLEHPAPAQRKIEYPVTPTLSVDAVQVKPIWVPDAAVGTDADEFVPFFEAGLANGGLVEMHYLADELYKRIYRGLPVPRDGWLTLPDTPGLGFEPDRDAIAEIARSSGPSAL